MTSERLPSSPPALKTVAATLGCILLMPGAGGCTPRANNDQCTVQSDCALGFVCLDGMCAPDRTGSTGGTAASDAGFLSFDAGSPGSDAGTSRDSSTKVDSQTPLVDSGSTPTDAGSPATDSGPPTADSGRPTPDSGSPRTCGIAACTVQGAECGQVVDECGAVVDCPSSCRTGYQCGTGSFANRCRCQPQSCAALGAECGSITDNCGVMRDCGGCSAPERCGGGGQSNQCGCVVTPRSTAFQVLGSAQNVAAPQGATNWSALGNGIQANGTGAYFSVTGRCGYEGAGGGGGCGCCARAEDRDITSNYLELTDADLSIPSGATIKGIEVQARLTRSTGQASLRDLSLVGGQTSDNRARSISISGRYETFTFGGPDDLWGRTWTPDQLNRSDFGARLQLYGLARCGSNDSSCRTTTVGVDYVRVRVHYDGCE